MSTKQSIDQLHITIRERKDRPGKFLVDVRRGPDRGTQTFGSLALATAYKRAVELAEARGEFIQQPPQPRTLKDAAEAFLEAKRLEQLSPATLTTYRTLLVDCAVRRLGPDRHLESITRRDIEQYRDARFADGVTSTTVIRELDRLRALFQWAKHRELCAKNPLEGLRFPKAAPNPKEWLRSPEIAPFLDACPEPFATIARFTLFTGLRRREVVFLQRRDVDLENNLIQIRRKPELGFRPKSGQERSVPIDPTLRPLLERHLREEVGPHADAWVFAQRGGERRSGSTRWFAVATQRAADAAGIARQLTFHDLRRTYGAMLIEAGVAIYEVSRLLGHSDVRVTQQLYAPLSGLYLAETAAKLGRHLGPRLTRAVPTLPRLLPGT
jgi:integrase